MTTSLSTRGRRARAFMLCLSGALAFVLVPATANAALDVTSFTGSVVQADGSVATQAGGHPYAATTTIEFASKPSAFNFPIPAESVKDLHVTLPPGFIGDPTATPRCSEAGFNDQKLGSSRCPASTQVGVAYINVGGGFDPSPVYNVVPPAGVPAVFGFNISSNTVRLVGSVRTGGDYGVTVDVKNASQYLGLLATRLTFWGVPADASHDADRVGVSGSGLAYGTSSEAPRLPFLTNPVDCSAGPLTTTLRASSWEEPTVFDTVSFDHDVNGDPLEVTGCDRVPFDPSITVRTTDRAAGGPSGLAFELRVPQNMNPDGIASSSLKKAVVQLPQGMTVSASAADGLAACSPAQIGLDNAQPAACPDAAKIGTVTVDTPLLEQPLEGSVYLAAQNDNPFGSLLALYIVAEGSGVVVKLPGRVDADPVTGQLTATFDNNPQLPFNSLKLAFDGGARASLAAPKACGTYATRSELTSWSGKTVVLTDSFTVDQNCDQAGKFEPTLDAGTVGTRAGGSFPFTLTLARPSGQQDISGLDVTLPAGLLGTIKGVPLCPDAQAAAGTCAPGSQIGRVTAASGPGTMPVYVPQPGKAPTAVYLAGPYKGAPYSLSIVVPAQAGPFDLGTVVVRAGLYVDPIDAHVTVKSDPIPTILQGIPLNLQKLNVVVDRDKFMLNPTSCDAKQIGALASSSAGASASLAVRFQVGECPSLDLEPKLALTLTGKGQTTDNKHPGIVAVLKQTPGQSNLKKVTVQLPLSLALDPDNAASDGLCSFVEGSKPEPKCPASSVVGTATARTPILDQPLSGPVYFTKNERKDPKTGRSIKTLPKLVVPLVGENGVKLTLTGVSSVPDGEHLVTTFENIPDAPVTDFTLNIAGGKKGILVVSHADLCKATQVAEQEVDGQNGKAADSDIVMSTPCSLGIAASSHTATALKLTVGGIGAGKVSVSGKGLTKATRSITSATAATLQPKLSSAIRRSLARGHNVKVRITVSFTPKGAKKAKTTHKTLTIHGAKKAKKR